MPLSSCVRIMGQGASLTWLVFKRICVGQSKNEFSPIIENQGLSNSVDLMYIKNVLASEEVFLKKKTKKGIDKLISINKSVKNVEIKDNKIFATLKTGQNQEIPSLRADEFIKFFYPDYRFNITRLEFYDGDMKRV